MKRVSQYFYLVSLLSIFNIDSIMAEEKLTRLRASDPEGTFETYRGATQLTRVQVRLKNVGEVQAEKIVVQVVLGSGRAVTLYGPSQLKEKSEVVYSASPYEYVTSSKKLRAEVSCDNCYK